MYIYTAELIDKYLDDFQKKGWFEPYYMETSFLGSTIEKHTVDIENMRNIFHKLAQRPNYRGSFFVVFLDILKERNPTDQGYEFGYFGYFEEIRGWFCFLIQMENDFGPNEKGNIIMMIDKLSREKITRK